MSKGEHTADLIGNSDVVVGILGSLFSEIANGFLDLLDDEFLAVLATNLQSIELLIESVFLVNCLVQSLKNLSVKNVWIMMRIERSRIRFSNRNPFPERLSHIALLSATLKVMYEIRGNTNLSMRLLSFLLPCTPS